MRIKVHEADSHTGMFSPTEAAGRRRGQALIEASLLVPMVFFLFLGLTNFGFFIYAFITVGNAARVATQYAAQFPDNSSSGGNQSVACQAALREMKTLPNVSALPSSYPCTAAPLKVTEEDYTEPTTSTKASRVTVTYDTIQLFPLPFMDGKMQINRTAVIRRTGLTSP